MRQCLRDTRIYGRLVPFSLLPGRRVCVHCRAHVARRFPPQISFSLEDLDAIRDALRDKQGGAEFRRGYRYRDCPLCFCNAQNFVVAPTKAAHERHVELMIAKHGCTKIGMLCWG